MKILTWLDEFFSKNENAKIDRLSEEKRSLIMQNTMLNDEVLFGSEAIDDLEEEILLLEESLLPEPLELYWNTKRAPGMKYYPARHIYGRTKNEAVDPRIFFVSNDNKIPIINGSDNDDKAMNALKYVNKYITYVTDDVQFKKAETWLFPFETWSTRRGDCEDGAILMANMMLKAGIPYWRIRLNAGDVKGGGHCWVTYLRESDDKWYILDWCYWPDDSKKWLLWSKAENYFSIWFSWNQDYVFVDDELDKEE